MMQFTLYDSTTHAVLYSGTASYPEALATGGAGLLLGVAHGPGFIDGGEFAPMPESPGPGHRFNYATRQWESTMTPEKRWSAIRVERGRRLTASDWTQLPDVPLATKEAWATYRQALRDITEQPDPFNITWPAVPG